MKSKKSVYEIIIVGGGVTGTADAFVLPRFTNVRKILLLEKWAELATVNSHPRNNAQTSHGGDTETNYSVRHALEVRQYSIFLRRYVASKHDPNLYRKHLRMALAVTPEEVAMLETRYQNIKDYYPVRLAYGKELAQIEPKVMEGRNPNAPICALVSTDGFIVNYQKLAEYFFRDAKFINPNFEHRFNTPVLDIKRIGDIYVLTTPEEVFYGKTVIFAAGPYSLYFAQKLGYGLDNAILPVAGSFMESRGWLNNKVYRCQVEGRPFAEIHGDPDILDMTMTRFGPTTKPLPLMERHHYGTFWDFLRLPLVSSLRGLASLIKIIWKKDLFLYVIKNIAFDLPIIGKALFLREIRKIVPTIRYRDLRFRRGAGGIRPQIVNLNTGELEMGDASLVGDNIIFNTTPSPGASVCLGNAQRDAKRIVEFLNKQTSGEYYFDEEAFQRELGELSQSKSKPA